MKYNAKDPYGTREHNKRIGNPFTVTRSPQAWARWENTQLAVRLFLFLFVWGPIVAFIAYWCLYALVAVAGE